MATTHTQSVSGSRAVEIPGLWWKAFAAIWMTATILMVFLYVGPVLDKTGRPFYTLEGHGAKALFFHVPCAWLASLTYVIGAIYAVRFLRARALGSPSAALLDFKGAASMELGLVFAILATVTGSLFAHNEWGAYWSWDPRQTSILVVMLLFAAYIVLRGAVVDPEVRARLSAVYTLVAVVPGLFLIWVLPRIMDTLHSEPNKAIVGRQIGGNYLITMYIFALPSFIALFAWLFQLRVRVMKLEAATQPE